MRLIPNAITGLSPAAILTYAALLATADSWHMKPRSGVSYSQKSWYVPSTVSTGHLKPWLSSLWKRLPSGMQWTSTGSPSKSRATSSTPQSTPHPCPS